MMRDEGSELRAYRELLGVTAQSSAEELKRAYHRLALLYHPDRNPEGSSHFIRIKEAYALLSDGRKVQELNSTAWKENLKAPIVEDLDICFGAFFGYRAFSGAASGTRVAKAFRLGSEVEGEDERDVLLELATQIESSTSILDSTGHDAIEIVYAGKFSVGDDERIKQNMGGSYLKRLPWVVLNNEGLIYFLDGDLKRAQQCYEELNARIPLNIIFMYRLGLCHILNGFKDKKRSLLVFSRYNKAEIQKGLRLFRQCISLGETRSVGKMKCLLIRKLMADVLLKLGRKRRAREIWREILKLQPKSIEANVRVNGWPAARKILLSKQRVLKARAADRRRSTAHPLLK